MRRNNIVYPTREAKEVHRQLPGVCSQKRMQKKIITYCFTLFVAAWVAFSSCGFTIEHHCAHCHHMREQMDEHTCEHDDHCDHCDHCWSTHLELNLYLLSHPIHLPAPDIHSLLWDLYGDNLLQIPLLTPRIWHVAIPWIDKDLGGRWVLHRIHKLSI